MKARVPRDRFRFIAAAMLLATVAHAPAAAQTAPARDADVAPGGLAVHAEREDRAVGKDAPEDRPVGPGRDEASGVWTTLLALAAVVGVLLLARPLLRRLGRRTAAGSADARLRVLSTTWLSGRERAVVVEFAGRTLLIGTGPGGTRTLCELPADEAAAKSPDSEPRSVTGGEGDG